MEILLNNISTLDVLRIFFNLTGIHWLDAYLIIAVGSAAWVMLDCLTNRVKPWKYVGMTLLCPPYGLGFYHNNKPLKPGQEQRGGRQWFYARAIYRLAVGFYFVWMLQYSFGDLANSMFDQEGGNRYTREPMFAFFMSGFWLLAVAGLTIVGGVVALMARSIARGYYKQYLLRTPKGYFHEEVTRTTETQTTIDLKELE